MTPETTPQTVTDKITVAVNLFDLEKFERRSVEKEIAFTPSKTMAEALERVGGDESKLLSIINTGEKRSARQEAKSSLYTETLVSPKAISAFVNGFKPLYKLESDTKDGRAKQRQQIYAFIRSNDAVLAAVKQAAAAFKDEDDDDSAVETSDEA